MIGTSGAQTPIKTTEILWDTDDVPHIYAKNNQDLFYAFGWAQMHSHGNLILRLYGQARGKAALYWGEDYLPSDRWVRIMGIPGRSQEWYEAQDPIFRDYLDRFAAGMNAYVEKYSDRIDDTVKQVLPLTGVDVLAHLQRVLNFSFVVHPGRVAALTKVPEAFLEQFYSFAPEEKGQKITYSPFLSDIGSNAWAIAPSRSASGHALLLTNPHLPWSDFFLWYEAHLISPDINAYGATLVGIPVLNMAFNEHLGWSHTVNTYDGWDAYELTLEDGGYQFDDRVKAFTTGQEILTIKQQNNQFRQESLTIKQSVHGPIVFEQEGVAIALRVAGLTESGALEQWWNMAKSQNLSEFETALQQLQIPMFTVMYADRDGHILHLFNGHVPVRSEGDFKFWSGLIPGNTSQTLWTKYHSYQDLPKVLDPPSGWLQNTNDPPWSTTFPIAINADDYPPYLAPQTPMDLRAQHSAKLLTSDEKISLKEMIEYKHSTHMELAQRLLDDLIPLAQSHSNPLVREAAQILADWNYRADGNSRGAVLFAFWAEAMDYSNLFAIPWDKNSPLTTPDGLADAQMAIATLETVVTQVKNKYGSLSVPWGEVFRFEAHGLDLPGNGGSSDLGIFRHFTFIPSENGQYKAVGGESYIAAVEFSQPVRAHVLNSYGNKTQPRTSANQKQLKLTSEKQLRPAWYSRQDVERHLVERCVLY
nr:acylase [Gloeothece citriformis]